MNEVRYQDAIAKVTNSTMTRRRFSVLAAAALATSLLAACGGDDDDDDDTQESEETQAESTSSEDASTESSTEDESADDESATESSDEAAEDETAAESNDSDDASSEGASDARLSVGITQGWQILDPPLYTGVSERQIFYSIYDSIIDMDENLDIVPKLASAWEMSEDGKQITFTLRDDVKFHDGTDFNADAVKFNIERILDPETASAQRSNIDTITSVEVIDPTTVTFTLSELFTPLLGNLTEGPGFQGSPTAIQNDPEGFGQNPVGTGPFVFTSWDKGVGILLTRNEDYWVEGEPKVAELYWQEIPDETVKMANFQSGEIDVIDVVPPKDVESVKSNSSYGYWEATGTYWPMMRLNLAQEPFSNKALRQAVSYAINRDAIIQAAYFGAATPAYGPISPIYEAYYDPEVEQYGYGYDPDQAKAKLDEAGLSSAEFTVDIQNNPTQQRIAEIMKSQLADVGITANIQVYEGTALQDRITNGLYQAVLGSWTPRPDIDGTIYRHFSTDGNVNSMGYSNPEVDELLAQTRTLPNGPERVDVYRQVQRLVVEDAPWVFLLFQKQVRAWQAYVEDVPNIPDMMFRFGPTSVQK